MSLLSVLLLGSGGREHALAWKIIQSPLVERVLCAPGNPGIASLEHVETVSIDPCDPAAVTAFARREGVGLVVVGPEAPLVAGVADALRAAGIPVVGPNQDGAILEGSKNACKEVLDAANVPTARWARVTSAAEIDAFCNTFDGDALVVKADGLAAGKGVIVCESVEEARAAAHTMLRERSFGDASDVIVLEERLLGIETSYIVLTDGTRFVAMPTSQDHKRLLDGDEGPNTGGMGAYSPAPFVTADVAQTIERSVIEPTLAELRRRGIDFRGFLYAGIMLTQRGPMVLEYNVRLGDPETQALLLAIDDDVVPALLGAARGELDPAPWQSTSPSAVIVLAADGYPDAPQKGAEISGASSCDIDGGVIFHAGTRQDPDGTLRVAGGRVLGAAARGDTPEDAIARAYRVADSVTFAGRQLRRDIGKALRMA